MWLDDAEAVLARGDEEGALARLVEGWAIVRAPELAEVVDALARRLLAARGGPPAGWPAATEPVGLVERGWLAEQLAPDGVAPAGERIGRVAAWPADPRTAAALTDLVRIPPFGGSRTRRFWNQVMQLLARLRDPRSVAVFDGLTDAYERSF